jgi:dipeptidase D
MRELVVSTYRELFGKEPQVKAIHAGLECGLFSGKLPGLDAVSFGPDMQNIHTSREKLSISSTARTWLLLCQTLGKMKD